MMEASSNPHLLWTRQADSAARRVNLALFLERFTPPFSVALVLACAAVLLLRSLEKSLIPVWGLILFFGLGLVIWLLVKLKLQFWTTSDALERLELSNSLQGQLSSAHVGVGKWPEFPFAQPALAWKWHPLRALGPLFFASIILWIAVKIPLPDRKDAPEIPVITPMAWQESANLIEALREEEVLQPESIEPFQKSLEQLASHPPEEWYSHNSLEAGDSLLADLKGNLAALSDSLAGADKALARAEAGHMDAASSDLREALQGMDASRLQIPGETAEALRNLAQNGALRELSADELKNMRMEVAELSEGLGECLGEGEGEGKYLLVKGVGQDGEKPGIGGVNRGPGEAPLQIGDLDRVAAPGTEVGIESQLSDDAALGDIVETRMKRPEDASEDFAIQHGGNARIEAGAEAVNRRPVTPEEQQILRRYFQ